MTEILEYFVLTNKQQKLYYLNVLKFEISLKKEVYSDHKSNWKFFLLFVVKKSTSYSILIYLYKLI